MSGCLASGDGGFVVEEVVGIVFGDGDVEEFELADGAVAAVRFDEDGGEGFDGDEFAIEFEVAFAFEDYVDFGGLFVVVRGRFVFDVEEVDGGGGLGKVCEAATGGAAAAVDGGEVAEFDGLVAFHRVNFDL